MSALLELTTVMKAHMLHMTVLIQRVATCVFVSCKHVELVISTIAIFHYADSNLCESTCEQHCASRVDNRCACDRGYYLASDHVSCIGKCMYVHPRLNVILLCRY